jgi:hypothetical protein
MMLSQIPMLQQLGLAFFIVVILDATLTRVYLVPSIMRHMKRLNWWAPGRIRRVPITPEEKLIPPIPMRTKLTVTVETLVIVGLGLILYLDYINNQYLQSFVNQTNSRLLAGINIWTGVILGVTSFLTTYILLRGKHVPGKTTRPRLLSKVGQQLGKLRPRHGKIPIIAAMSDPSPSLSSQGPVAITQTASQATIQNREHPPTKASNSTEEKKEQA